MGHHTFFARTRPEIEPSPGRRQAMMAGTGFHEVFGRAVSTEEFVEQLVEFEEIVGKIDIYENVPLELKTTLAIPADPLTWRPAHVEQLGMYCAMVGRPAGHLLYYRRSEWGRPPELRAFDVAFADLPAITAEMVRRRDLLREALDTGSPAGLPRCEWFGRDCDYEAICGCTSASPLVRMVGAGAVRVRENSSLADRLLATVAADPPREGFGLNDLVFPRKAAFRRQPGVEEEEEGPQERLASWQRRGFDEQLSDAVWYGFPGESRRIRVPFGSIWASVLLFRGVPTIMRTNRQREMVDRRRLAEVLPHYVDRLGFECALANSDRGRLIVYYAAVADDKFMVYDLWFQSRDAILDEMARRLKLLESGSPPHDVPACQPAWMERFCRFAPGCRCSAG